MVRLLGWFAAAAAVLLLGAGCDDGCDSDSDCPEGSYCEAGLCLVGSPGDGAGGTGGDLHTGGTGGSGGTENPGGAGGEPCAPARDADGDGVCDDADNCPDRANPSQEDADGDGAGDACDPCPLDPDDDADGDGFCADHDLCPTVADPDQADLDGDGRGDACDDDIDGDGVANDADCDPRDADVYPGAPDPCDGIDRDCHPGSCRVLATAGDPEQRLVDVACLPDSSLCTAVIAPAAGDGAVLLLDLTVPGPLAVVSLPAPLGVAASVWNGKAVAWVASEDALRAVAIQGSGETLATLAPASGSFLGPVAVSPAGDVVVAALADSRFVVVGAETALGQNVPGPCDFADPRCRLHDFSALWTSLGELGPRAAHRVALLPRTSPFRAYAFLTYEDSRVATGLAVDRDFQTHGLDPVDPFHPAPTELAVDPEAGRVYLATSNGQGMLVRPAAVPQERHEKASFALGSDLCPTALGFFSGRLWLGDHCPGDEPRLLAFTPGEDGRPQGPPEIHPLPSDCTPGAVVPTVPDGPWGDVFPAIGCTGGDSLLVLGHD